MEYYILYKVMKCKQQFSDRNEDVDGYQIYIQKNSRINLQNRSLKDFKITVRCFDDR